MKVPKYYADIYKKSRKVIRKNTIESCDRCKGTGFIFFKDEDGTERYRDCTCVGEYLTGAVYCEHGINAKYLDIDLDWLKENFKRETVQKIDVLSNNIEELLNVNFILYPKTSKHWGSNHVGNFLFKKILEQGQREAVVSSTKSLIDLFFAWDKPDLQECLKWLQNIDCLLIDEMGSEYNKKMKEKNSFIVQSFNSFLMERNRMDKPTIISTNLPIDDFDKCYAKEIVENLSQMFVGLCVESKGKRSNEFDDLKFKIKKPEMLDCFENLEDKKKKKKKKGLY